MSADSGFPGGELVDGPVVQMTESVWVDVPPSAVWPWLVQIGRDRGGLYLPEALRDMLGLDYPNAKRIHSKWQQTVVGDPVPVAPQGWMGRPDGVALAVAEIVPNQYLCYERHMRARRWRCGHPVCCCRATVAAAFWPGYGPLRAIRAP